MTRQSRSVLVHASVLPALEFGRVVECGREAILVAVDSLGAEPRRAECLAGLTELEPGDRVVVALVGEERQVVVLGRLADATAPARDVHVNGRRVTIEADSELVLRCASATITIRRDGMVAVRGDRVVSHARGANRIRGGSVELN
jgi:hypothetical protein